MATKKLLTILSASALESLRAASGLTNGLEYHDSTNGIRYIATAVNALIALESYLTKFTAGMYAYNKAIPFNITVADTYHAVHLVSSGDIVSGTLNNWTFTAGRVVNANITSEGNGTGGKLRIVCSAAHGLTTGNLVVLGSMNNPAHNKKTRITTDGTNPTTEFLCDDITYVSGSGTSAGNVDEPAQLIAGATAAGIYSATLNINGTAASQNKYWKFELNTNIAANDNIVTERYSSSTLTSVSTSGIITIAAGDKVWISGKNITDTTDYIIKHLNLYLFKV